MQVTAVQADLVIVIFGVATTMEIMEEMVHLALLQRTAN